jgi:hypothetical protein
MHDFEDARPTFEADELTDSECVRHVSPYSFHGPKLQRVCHEAQQGAIYAIGLRQRAAELP